MEIIKSIHNRWLQTNLMLRIFAGIVVGSVLALTVPGVSAVSMLGDLFVGALKAMALVLVAVGFIIGVVQDSVETALNSSGDAMFTIASEMRERLKRGEKIEL